MISRTLPVLLFVLTVASVVLVSVGFSVSADLAVDEDFSVLSGDVADVEAVVSSFTDVEAVAFEVDSDEASDVVSADVSCVFSAVQPQRSVKTNSRQKTDFKYFI